MSQGSASSDLLTAKKNLQGALGERMKKYYELLKAWFKQTMTREDFDHEARKLLTMDSVHLHNQFILALLCKCQSLGSSLAKPSSSEPPRAIPQPTGSSKVVKKIKKKRSYVGSEKLPVSQFVPVNPLIVAPHIPEQAAEQDDPGELLSARQMALPDLGMLHGRLLVGAWEHGLDEVNDQALKLLHHAVQIHLKNVLSAVISRRGGYKVREKRFRYAMGADVPPATQRNSLYIEDYSADSEATSVTVRGQYIPSVKPTVETAERNAAVVAASFGCPPPPKAKITLHDLYKALQVHKSAIPCHSVYATNMERIVNRMWHASHSELMHDEIHRSEVRKKQDLYAQHMASRVQ